VPESPSKRTDWLSVVEDAAWLWILMEVGRSKPELDDAVLAIDPSVAMLFATPSETRDPPSVFNSVSDSIAPDLSFILGAITKQSAQDRGLLLHGHDVEFQSIYSALLQRASRQRLTEDQLYGGNTENHIKDNDLEHFLKLNLVRERFKSDRAKFTLLSEFIKDTRLSRPESAAEDNLIQRIAPSDKRLESLAEAWFDGLRERKSARTAKHRVYSDAIALSHLCWVNENREEGARPVYLVTADPHIHETGMEEALSGYEYVIDPRYLLFREEVSVGSQATTSYDGYGLEDWIRVLLSPFRTAGHLTINDAHKLHVKISEMRKKHREFNAFLASIYGNLQGDAVEDFPNRLERFIRLNLNSQSRDILSNHAFFADLGKAIFENRQQDAESTLRHWQISVLTDVTTTALATSLVASNKLAPSLPKMNSRMPMAIRYRDNLYRAVFMRELERSAKTGVINELSYGETLREKYTVQLVSCQLHAKFGDWEAAESLSRMAILLSELSEEGDPIFGHEAFYANAVCLRHLLRTPSDLEAIELSLEEAERRWAERFSEEEDKRIELEEISLDLTSRYLAKYFSEEGWGAKLLKHSGESNDSILTKLADLNRELRRLIDSETHEYPVYLSMLKQCAMNGISTITLRLIDGEVGVDSAVTDARLDEFSEALELLSDQLSRNEDFERLISSDYFYFSLELSRAFQRRSKAGSFGDLAKLKEQAQRVRERLELRYDDKKISDIVSVLN
jgi:hypothetical protein